LGSGGIQFAQAAIFLRTGNRWRERGCNYVVVAAVQSGLKARNLGNAFGLRRFMISSSWTETAAITPVTVHNHGQCPECVNMGF